MIHRDKSLSDKMSMDKLKTSNRRAFLVEIFSSTTTLSPFNTPTKVQEPANFKFGLCKSVLKSKKALKECLIATLLT